LNCETLSSSLGLELRWSVTGDGSAIILQLVSATGTDRYLALGVRSPQAGSRGIAGDVIVGWINSRTGKGDVDDYFLAAEDNAADGVHCDDGAESCPDKNKKVRQMPYTFLNFSACVLKHISLV
jgi:hypothetical protein